MARAINVSLPKEVMERLNKESEAIGINRSAYISLALHQKWQSDEMVRNLPMMTRALQDLLDTQKQKSLDTEE